MSQVRKSTVEEISHDMGHIKNGLKIWQPCLGPQKPNIPVQFDPVQFDSENQAVVVMNP